jgi:hypothetical protein
VRSGFAAFGVSALAGAVLALGVAGAAGVAVCANADPASISDAAAVTRRREVKVVMG